MRINKNDKILFILSDYGSRNIILSLIKINKLKNHQIYDLKKKIIKKFIIQIMI